MKRTLGRLPAPLEVLGQVLSIGYQETIMGVLHPVFCYLKERAQDWLFGAMGIAVTDTVTPWHRLSPVLSPAPRVPSPP